MSQSNAQRTVNVIRTAVDQMTRDGAKISYRCGVVVNGGSSLISAYLDGDNSAISEDIKVYAGTYVNTGDYVIIGVSNEGETWLEEVISYSAYAKLVLDYNQAQIKIGSGTSEPATGSDGQLLFSAGTTQPNYWSFPNELCVAVRNTTGATLTAGTAVYISSVSGQIPIVSKASSSSESTSSKTLGLVRQDILDNEQGYVTTFGVIKNVNTSAYSPGTSLWLSPTAGQWTNVKAVPPNHLVSIGKVIHDSATAGRIFVSIQNGFELEELHNVYIQSTPEDGQVLVYDYASSYWKPGTASSVAALNDLTDVTITSPSSGNILSYNGSAWINSSPSTSSFLGAKLSLTSAYSIADSTDVPVSFNSTNSSEDWDASGWHDPNSNPTRIKPTTAGKMLVQAQVGFASSTGQRWAYLVVNGNPSTGTVIGRTTLNIAAGGVQTYMNVVGQYDFNGSTDYVELYVRQNSGTVGGINLLAGSWVAVSSLAGLTGATGATGATGPAGPEGGTTLVTSSTATNTSVADAATAQTILASNASRKGFSVFNDSDKYAYLKFGSAASATDFTMKLAPYGFYEMFGDCLYTGALTAIWASDSTGSARVSEW